MATYDVVLQDGTGRCSWPGIRASGPSEALIRARGLSAGSRDHVYAVYRRRRGRGRQLMGYFAGGAPGDDGTAGVREPRRPLPSPPSLHAEAPLPLG